MRKNDNFTHFNLLILCIRLQVINKVKVTHQGQGQIKVKVKISTSLQIQCSPYSLQTGGLHLTEMLLVESEFRSKFLHRNRPRIPGFPRREGEHQPWQFWSIILIDNTFDISAVAILNCLPYRRGLGWCICRGIVSERRPLLAPRPRLGCTHSRRWCWRSGGGGAPRARGSGLLGPRSQGRLLRTCHVMKGNTV